MLITGITHANAGGKDNHPFKALTAQGVHEVDSLADRFRELVGDKAPPIDAIISSPKVRCLETAVLFYKASYHHFSTSDFQVDAGLKPGSIEGSELMNLANGAHFEHCLISAHADIVRAFPPNAALLPESQKNRWFAIRPVLFQLTYQPGGSWDTASLLFCEGLFDGQWQDLRQP